MKKTILPLALLLAVTACQSKEDQKKHDAMVAQQARAELLAELKAKEAAQKKAALQAERNRSKFEKVGIHVEGSKIIIDTNKTKTFFKNMTEKLARKMQKIEEDLQKGRLEENETGIKIDENRINIDLNKAKGFFESWGKKMQEIVKSLDEVSKKIEPAVTPENSDLSKLPPQ